MEALERRAVALRHDGERVISGVVMRYGAEATIGGAFRERVEAGALGTPQDVILNIQHDRARPIARQGHGLHLVDSGEALEMRAELPRTRDAEDALAMVEAGLLQGLSVELRVEADEWTRDATGGHLRTIQKALLSGIGLVDKPAYTASELEARARDLLECHINRHYRKMAALEIWL